MMKIDIKMETTMMETEREVEMAGHQTSAMMVMAMPVMAEEEEEAAVIIT